jgi:hypothetical protein
MKSLRFMFGSAALCLAVVGCGSQESAPTTPPKTTNGKPAEEGHSHGDGPHGGVIADWGGGTYHVEFTVDHDKKEATVYIVGSDGKSPAPIKAEKIHLLIKDPETELDLIAQPLEGEAAGTSSRFVGTHDTIGIVKEFEGTITGEVDGTPYVGEFKELPH